MKQGRDTERLSCDEGEERSSSIVTRDAHFEEYYVWLSAGSRRDGILGVGYLTCTCPGKKLNGRGREGVELATAVHKSFDNVPSKMISLVFLESGCVKFSLSYSHTVLVSVILDFCSVLKEVFSNALLAFSVR